MRTKRSARKSLRVGVLVILFLSGSLLPTKLLLTGPVSTPSVNADSTPQTLPFTQNWSSTGQITTDDNWAGVPGIVGFRGDDLTTVTGTDPQTILADGSGTPVDVIANQTNPNTQATGGVGEFDGIANPVVALQGSGTADAPHIVITVNTTGMSGVKVAYNIRDIDGSADNAVQPVALQFRVGASGNYTNIPTGFVADGTTGPSLATLVTPVSATLPAAADNQPLVQIRIMTTNAVGNDEWVGIDDLIVFVPSEAKLDSFDATRHTNGKVLLKWRTGFEVDNLGFNIYREIKGKQTRVNSELIAGSALMVGQGTRLRSGYSYAWADDPQNARDARYSLEAVDLSGRTEMFGPVSTRRAEGGAGLPRQSDRAVLLSTIGAKSSRANTSTIVARTASAFRADASQLAVIATGTVAKPALKLLVDREGWYRVSREELAAAGLSATADPRRLQLFAQGQEQAIIVKGEDDGRFDAADAIEFYGIGLDTPSTNTRTYWLVEGEQAGLRIKAAKAKGSKAAATGFSYTVERRDKTVYFSSLRNGEKENFFGAVLAGNPVDQTLSAQHIDRASAEDAVLEVALQGVTDVDHRVAVRFNGNDLGDIVFTLKENKSARFTVPRAALREGENIVTLTNHEVSGDVSLVDSLRLTYRRAYTADGDALRFSAAGKRVLTIDGFTSSDIRVVDVTDPASPSEVKAKTEQRGNGYAARIKTPKGGERVLMAFSDGQVKHPVRVLADQPSDLKDRSREAGLVIVTRSDFIAAIEPLVELRRGEGMKVAVVDVQDIYDEFSFGEKSASALKDFFAYAHSNWSEPPRFALIVGDASLDPKNYMGLGDFDLIPTRMIDTPLMETSCDEWLVDSDDDGLGELAAGRLPARSADEAALMIAKSVAYQNAAAPNGVLLISDSNDGIDFESGTGRLRGLVPSGVTIEEIVRGRVADGVTRDQVLDGVRRGKRIVSYFGHGSVDLWRGGILTSADVGGTAGGNGLSLFLSITCLNGYFQDPALDGLAESLLKAPGGAAAAVWASSGMCEADGQLAMNLEMFRVLFNDGPLTLGDAILKAKAATSDSSVRQTYILFGDPSARIR